MPICYVVQPVHSAGLEMLREAGIVVRMASAADMATVIREIGDAEAVITRDAGLSGAAIAAASRLRVIANHGVGTNRLDLASAKQRGIVVVNTPGTNARSVAEHTIGLMLAAARRSLEADRAVRGQQWEFRHSGGMIELADKTLGLIGFGTIAQMVAAIARGGFGMKLVTFSPRAPDAALQALEVARAPDLPNLLASADFVSLHRPLRPDTRHTLDAAALAAMKPGSVLVNTGRGELLDTESLCEVLKHGPLRAAALDVFPVEPVPADSPLLSLPNVILSPHTGGSTDDAMRRTALCCARQIIDVLAGRTALYRVV